jgi:L-rhamnose isomerase
MPSTKSIQAAYKLARETYAELGVDTEAALRDIRKVPISLHCWQGDDLGGFESVVQELGGGIAVTGNHPGKARNIGELRGDLEKVYSLIPGHHRLALHSIYGEFGGKAIPRNEITPAHFKGWIEWAKANNLGLDFNQTCFSHPLAADGFTLTHTDKAIRQFWIEHCIASRKIGAAIGKAQGNPCITNLWIPDGYKDTPADRKAPRQRLEESLDAVFASPISPKHNLDSVEPKLFGLGSESYVVGSTEFYLGYAIRNKKLLCLDTGHFHPTESIADKISSVLQSLDEILFHVSRGVRWDSDHVVTLSDELLMMGQEMVRGKYLDRIHIGLDFFDGSINRIAAWTVGTRSAIKALLIAMLEPTTLLQKSENAKDYGSRLTLLEACKTLPYGAVWEYYCEQSGTPGEIGLLHELQKYEREVLSRR